MVLEEQGRGRSLYIIVVSEFEVPRSVQESRLTSLGPGETRLCIAVRPPYVIVKRIDFFFLTIVNDQIDSNTHDQSRFDFPSMNFDELR